MDDRFIADLNKKKEAAWKELYTDFYPALCSYSARIIRNEDEVEDVVQECLIGLWHSSLVFPNIQALVSWLYRSVYHRSLNVVRGRNNANKLAGVLQKFQEEEADETAALEAIEEEVVRRLRKVVADLSGQQQQIIHWSLEGRKVREIANRLGVSENAVKMQKKRAYAFIRERMGKMWMILLITYFPNIF